MNSTGEKCAEVLTPCQYNNMLLKPTQIAPDFVADAYYRGKDVKIKLSDFQNQWIGLFFYASDFTFV